MRYRNKRYQRGSSLIEVLVSIGILSIMSLSLTRSTITSIRLREKSIRDAAALELAFETLEDLASIDPVTLNDTDDATETATVGQTSYSVTTDITVNADSTRSIDITVSPSSPGLGGNATLSSVFGPWGEV